MTAGYDLSAKHVIHTVGPVWHGGKGKEDQLLAACYRNSLQLAAEHHLRSVAFPSISTGAYGFPIDRASRIAIREVADFLNGHESMEILFACFSAGDRDAYQKALNELVQGE